MRLLLWPINIVNFLEGTLLNFIFTCVLFIWRNKTKIYVGINTIDVRIEGNRLKVTQLIINQINNAIDFFKERKITNKAVKDFLNSN